MYQKELGFIGKEAKIALKFVHTLVGYVFVTNLLIRGISGLLIKSKSNVPASMKQLRIYLRTIFSSNRPSAATVRPASKFMVYVLFGFMSVSAATGLVRTGTDLYMFPLGPLVANWVAESPEQTALLNPRNREHTDTDRYNLLNQVKIPFGWLHRWSAYLLLPLLAIHFRLAYDLSVISRRRKQ